MGLRISRPVGYDFRSFSLFPRDLPEPFRLAIEHYDAEVLDSVYTEYVGRGRRLRLIWDGRDRWLWIEAGSQGNEHPAPADCHDLERDVGEAPGRISPVDSQNTAERLANLKVAVNAMLRGLGG